MSNLSKDPALSGFVGFFCSFGGKWRGGYAKACKSTRNYAEDAAKGLQRIISTVADATFTCLDYKDVIIKDGSVVYADPPYANTTGYSLGKFDSDEFWDYIRKISRNNYVYVSEQTAPDDFECIWEKSVRRILNRNTDNRQVKTEKLFVYKYGLKDM